MVISFPLICDWLQSVIVYLVKRARERRDPVDVQSLFSTLVVDHKMEPKTKKQGAMMRLQHVDLQNQDVIIEASPSVFN